MDAGCLLESVSDRVDVPPHDVIDRLFGSNALAKHRRPNQAFVAQTIGADRGSVMDLGEK